MTKLQRPRSRRPDGMTAVAKLVLLPLLLLASSTRPYGRVVAFSPTLSSSTRQQQQQQQQQHQKSHQSNMKYRTSTVAPLFGWVQKEGGEDEGEWEWQEDDPHFVATAPTTTTMASTASAATTSSRTIQASATPQLPSGSYKPKQSLGQNYLRDGNTVAKIIRAFHQDILLLPTTTKTPTTSTGGSSSDETERLDNSQQQQSPSNNNNNNNNSLINNIVELGPGAGALTDKLVETFGVDAIHCVIEIDPRSVELLQEKHPNLHVRHEDVLQVNYPQLAAQIIGGDGGGGTPTPLAVIGNLPYYITSQILFALADASHSGAVASATVTMQWEVGQRMVAPPRTKDYGILSVVFQLYADVQLHFKIPPTVFYPKPKVDSALLGLHFIGPQRLTARLGGVSPVHLRRVVTTAFQQRRKTLRNSLRKVAREVVVIRHKNKENDVSESNDGGGGGGDNYDAAEAVAALFQQQPAPPPPTTGDNDGMFQESDQAFFASRALPPDWASKRPEELTCGQFVEVTRILFGPHHQHQQHLQPQHDDYNASGNGRSIIWNDDDDDDDDADANDDIDASSSFLGTKVWRKLKHGSE